MANRCRRYAGHGYHGPGDAARNRFGAGGVVGTVPATRAVQDALPLIENRRPRDGSHSVVMFVMMSLKLYLLGLKVTRDVFVAGRVRLLQWTVQHTVRLGRLILEMT